ncbi:MAG: hypothetical protein ACKVOO_03295 [Burkholderiaceae bacterium]
MTISKLRIALAAAALGLCTAQAASAATSVSINVHQPGVYGRVVFGEPLPRNAWVNANPVVVTQPNVYYQREPIYLYVPPGHYNNWSRHCSRYNACTQPVVFVQDRWIRERHAQYRGGRDDDRDGVRNRYDRDRDGDGIRNKNDRDRDGDGTRNKKDRRPDNPYQR